MENASRQAFATQNTTPESDSDKIRRQYQQELAWGKPIVYKDVPIYPILMTDAHSFQMAVMALTYDLLAYSDKSLAFKPRLNFLIEMGKLSHNSNDYGSIELQLWTCFCYLLTLSFKTDEIRFTDPKNPKRKVLSITYTSEINGSDIKQTRVFGSNEFEEIRKIILILNGVEVDDEFIHADIKERMAQDAKILNKSKYDPPDMEDLIDIVFMYTGKDYEFIEKMNLRKFTRLIKRISLYEDYKIVKSAQMSGFVTIKEEVKSWISSLEDKGKFQGLVQSKDKLLSTYQQING